MQEDIRFGECIRKYEIEGLVDKKWQILTTGESIGHKRIEKFESIKVSQLRLIIKDSEREPIIKNISAYFVSEL